jgi:hypothetical protein
MVRRDVGVPVVSVPGVPGVPLIGRRVGSEGCTEEFKSYNAKLYPSRHMHSLPSSLYLTAPSSQLA